MIKRTHLPIQSQLEKLLEKLLPPNEEMDEESARMILENAGVDTSTLADDLKRRLERRVQELRAGSKDIPPDLIEVITSLNSRTP